MEEQVPETVVEEVIPEEWLEIWNRISETRQVIDFPCLGGG